MEDDEPSGRVCSELLMSPISHRPECPTLFDGKVGHGESHGVAAEDVVPAVDVLPIDRESPARQQSDHSPRHICKFQSLEMSLIWMVLWFCIIKKTPFLPSICTEFNADCRYKYWDGERVRIQRILIKKNHFSPRDCEISS